jgi:D-arabinose 1-dehydrogenase-like Zn-dependent alcohol dehydrogenase
MHAAVLARPGQFEFNRGDVPGSKVGETLVQIEGCGVCRSNVPSWEGQP